ncbi:hypothetical protein [Methanothrix sp.]
MCHPYVWRNIKVEDVVLGKTSEEASDSSLWRLLAELLELILRPSTAS